VTGFLDNPPPRWFTIPAHRPFLEDLADGVWRALSPFGAEALADAVILVPTRRAARALADAFLSVCGGKAVILPQIRALGDLDEGEPPFEVGDLALDLPPAIQPPHRRFELAGLVVEHQGLLERRLDAVAALDMADALAAFLDSCQIEEADPAGVESLVEGELARHWLVSARFLKVALDAWPRRLEDLGLMDVAARRVLLIRRLADRWSDRPPSNVLIAAGSTGSTPAAADLLAAIAAAPRGCAVLPGLDKSLADGAWNEVGEQHPQGAMRRLLGRVGLGRDQVADWDPVAEAEPAGRWRRRLVNEALRPPEATSDWLAQIDALRAEGAAAGVDPIAAGLEGLSVVTARTEEEAATMAALMLREALETPGKTAILISPDAALARRVSARLTRWNVGADSSAGQPLAGAPAAVLAGLVARLVADPSDPVTLLAIVKHPLTRLGWEVDALTRARVVLERHALRGPRPDGWEGVNDRLREALVRARAADEPSEGRIAGLDRAIDLTARLREALGVAEQPYTGETAATPAQAARALCEALEALATGQRGGVGDLWAGQGGEALGSLLSSLIAESSSLPEVTRRAFAELIEGLLARALMRPGGASHPRLRILGVLEARLVRADLLILAGLEEGRWPAGAPIDPFLSRPMRERLGLPPPERRIGLSAHDFAQAACAPQVVLLNSERRGGSPAVASRWLWRLSTLVKGAGLELPGRLDIVAWAKALDAPLPEPPLELRTAPRPNPKPPVSARPRKLAVTAIERWVRDPYGLYAREILKLRSLDRPDEPVEALARGTAIHAAFERFARDHPDELPQGAHGVFTAFLLEELRRAGMPEARMAREQALAINVAPWVIDFEQRRRPGATLIVERQGAFSFDGRAGPFTVTARADRIEVRGALADVLDFKTGVAPSPKMVRVGLSPQLTLTGAILAGGGFADLGPLTPGGLLYVRVNGGRTPGREEARDDGDAAGLAREALRRLREKVAEFDQVDEFDDPVAGYLSWAAPQFIGLQGGDYDHLARLWEWYVVGESGGEE